MKFNLVPIGEQFSYEGVLYTKAGPISACADIDGKNRMIPRSANVTLSNQVDAGACPATDEKLIPITNVITAVNNYHEQCLESLVLVKNKISQERLDDIKIKLNSAHQNLINSFKKM